VKLHTALKYNRDTIVISGFSKFFSMAGFRVGWMVVPDNLIREAEIIAQNILISAPTISQYSALGAFDYHYLNSVRPRSLKEEETFYIVS